jgi:VanZ family protein
MKTVTKFTLLRFWRIVGWFGLVLLLYLSLTPYPPQIPIEQGDKYGHALAYSVLMYWWAQLLTSPGRRLGLGVALVALGIAIEYLQRWSGWRTFEYFDMLADAAGVAIGWAIAAVTPNFIALLARRSIVR